MIDALTTSSRLAPWSAVVAVLVWLALPGQASADDPFQGWHTLETERFIIHYHDGLGEVSKRVARLCEEAHLQLAPLLDWEPAEKTHVVLDDNVDTSNGSAVIVPRNTIRLFLYGPAARGSLGDYDDWLRGLIIHEYTHILHIDTISGLPAVLNDLLGKRASPNQLVPRWFTEGFATYQESARTEGGRVRSSLFHMYLRTAYLDSNLFDLGDLSGTPYAWPRGTSPYLYGAHFLAYIAETRGEDFFRRFNHIYGSRVIPYSMNNTAREILGEDFVQLYNEWQAHIAKVYGAQIEGLRGEGVTQIEDVTITGQSANSPRPRPGTRQVSFYTSPGNDAAGIYAHDLDTGEVDRIFRTPGGGGPHKWDPTGRYAVFHSSRYHRNTHLFNELILRDTKTGDELQLTRNSRARDPDFGPKGDQVAFVENNKGSTRLVLMDLKSRTRRVLFDNGDQGQLDTPCFSPDGRFIATSLWRGGTGRDIFVYDLVQKRMIQLTGDQALDLEPSFSPDGRWLLFSSDRTRVYDIYAMDVGELSVRANAAASRLPDKVLRITDLPIWRVTRVERGLFTPYVVQDGDKSWLYVSHFKVKGFDIGRIPFDPANFLGPAPASRRDRPKIIYPEVEGALITKEAETYAPWRYLLPRTVSPLLAITSGRGSYGVELAGFDPVGHHFWAMTGEYFTESETSLIVTNYSYTRLPVSLNFGFQHSIFERTRGLVAESRFVPFKEQAYDGQVSVGIPLRSSRETHRISIGYNLRFTDFFEEPEVTHDPADITPQAPTQGNFSSAFISYFFGDTDRFGQSVTTEEGYSLSLNLRFRDEITGSEVSSVQATYSGSYFVKAPWIDHHAFVLRARGGFARTNFRRREQFSVGGVPPQEVLTAIINEAPMGGSFLRGFEPGTAFGEQFHIFTGEYRYPILNLEQGFDTLPFHFGRLSGSIFSDSGSAFNDAIGDARFFHGLGTEVLLETTLGYALPLFFRLGYAHGFGSAGIDDFYFFLGGSY